MQLQLSSVIHLVSLDSNHIHIHTYVLIYVPLIAVYDKSILNFTWFAVTYSVRTYTYVSQQVSTVHTYIHTDVRACIQMCFQYNSSLMALHRQGSPM